MIITLFQPVDKNWLIAAFDLKDPSGWDHFVPYHSTDSDRYKFDTAVKTLANSGLSVRQCRDMLSSGRSIFEYGWDASEEDILEHALKVAQMLGVELCMDVEEAA